MRSRFTKFAASIAALAALAVGGSAIASAAHKSGTPAPPAQPSSAPASAPAPATDGDNVQQGDQSPPDAKDAAAEAAASESTGAAETPGAVEKAGSEVDANDGPGGFADSSANADTQQEGAN
jgi:hypothetical protein